MSESLFPQESIYNHILKKKPPVEKPQRYTSRFRPMVVQEEKSTKSPMKTLGPLKGEVPSPERYLRKHSKEPKLPDKTQCCKQTQRMCTSRKPPLPARTDRPPMGVCTKRDVNQTKTQRKPEPACVDSNKGHRELLENSGLVPKYIKKKDYGEVPGYLQQHLDREVQRAQEEYEKFVEEQKAQEAIRVNTDKERQARLQTLKNNWRILQQVYQGLPMVTDTLSKKARKEQLEAWLEKLEKEMDVIKRIQTRSALNAAAN